MSDSWTPPDLAGTVALVAGATRGAGRAIAVELGAAGATVYCTGRSTRAGRSDMDRPETIEETAERVTAAGGTGIPVAVDHTVEAEVERLFDRLANEQDGRLDLLVNDVWGGDDLTEWGKPFWELTLAKGAVMLERAVLSHLITARHGAPLMVARGRGLIVEITDGDDLSYRQNLFYDLAKVSVIRIASGMAQELTDHGVVALALTPGFMRSEAVLDHFGVSEANWRDAVARDPYFEGSETPHYLGRTVAALAADPGVGARAGEVWSTWKLAPHYGVVDVDGRQPHWGDFYAKMRAERGGSDS